MRNQRDEPTPVELLSVAERLRGCRYEASPLDLDRIKQRAMAQVSSRPSGNPHKGMFMRSKLLGTALAVGLLFSTTSVGLAITGNFPSIGSSKSSTRGAPTKKASSKKNASYGQYAGSEQCKTLRRENRADEKELREDDKRTAKGLRKSQRRDFRAESKSRRKLFRVQNLRDERRCSRTGDS